MLGRRWLKDKSEYREVPKISGTRNFFVTILKFEQGGFTIHVLRPKDADRMANSVDPDQTAPDLGLHSLPRPICPKT